MVEPARERLSEEDVAKRCPTCGAGYGPAESRCPKDGAALTDAQPDALIGTVLAGTYRVTRVLAAGGMGRVYEAEHTRLGRTLVVKVMLESHAFNAEVLERAEREAQAIARVRSEHVVDVVDVLRTQDGRPCLVVDHLDGEDLGARLARTGRMAIGEAVSVARQLCAGMHAAHAVGVVHRDLKPSNVFLVDRPDGKLAKILDFGVAKLEGGGDLTRTGAVVGTPAYMAPEQALDAGRVDHRTDVYAIGAILYHMLTGVPPYGTDDATLALMELLKGEPPRARSVLKKIPEDLEAVLERAMAREPAQRTPTVEQLAHELEPFDTKVLGGGRPLALDARPSSPGPSSRWTRSRAVLLTGALLLAVAAWSPAFAAVVLLSVIAPASPTDVQALIPWIAMGGASLLFLGLGMRALISRWRSLPRVEAHHRALGRALAAGLMTTAVVEAAALAYRGLAGLEAPPGDPEHAVALGLGGMAGLLAFTISRWRS